MSPARHIDLNRGRELVDSVNMPTPITTVSTVSAAGANSSMEAPPTTQFAHELANLLDGSMRNVALVRSLLDDKEAGTGAAAIAATDDLLLRLQTAEQGMKHMATLIKRWMHESGQPAVMLHRSRATLGEAIDQARELHRPAAAALGIEIRTQVSDDVALLPAHALTPVLSNAIRNSIEAISQDAQHENNGVVEIEATVRDGTVRLTVTDNGPGLSRSVIDFAGIFNFGMSTKEGGHGEGLKICREIARQMGGTLRMANRVKGRGAILTLTYPVDAACPA